MSQPNNRVTGMPIFAETERDEPESDEAPEPDLAEGLFGLTVAQSEFIRAAEKDWKLKTRAADSPEYRWLRRLRARARQHILKLIKRQSEK